jgi:hypothetical protein
MVGVPMARPMTDGTVLLTDDCRDLIFSERHGRLAGKQEHTRIPLPRSAETVQRETTGRKWRIDSPRESSKTGRKTAPVMMRIADTNRWLGLQMRKG